MKSQDLQIAQYYKQRIQNLSPVKRMIVFGSRSRGNATNESDMDIFVELKNITPFLRKQILEIAWEIGLDNGLVLSTIITSTEMLRNSPLAGNPLLEVIQQEGVQI